MWLAVLCVDGGLHMVYSTPPSQQSTLECIGVNLVEIKTMCQVPDDSISIRSYPLFMARTALVEFIQEQRVAGQTDAA